MHDYQYAFYGSYREEAPGSQYVGEESCAQLDIPHLQRLNSPCDQFSATRTSNHVGMAVKKGCMCQWIDPTVRETRFRSPTEASELSRIVRTGSATPCHAAAKVPQIFGRAKRTLTDPVTGTVKIKVRDSRAKCVDSTLRLGSGMARHCAAVVFGVLANTSHHTLSPFGGLAWLLHFADHFCAPVAN